MKPVRMRVEYWPGNPHGWTGDSVNPIAPCWDVFTVMDAPEGDPDWQWLGNFDTLARAVDWATGYCEGWRQEDARLAEGR